MMWRQMEELGGGVGGGGNTLGLSETSFTDLSLGELGDGEKIRTV